MKPQQTAGSTSSVLISVLSEFHTWACLTRTTCESAQLSPGDPVTPSSPRFTAFRKAGGTDPRPCSATGGDPREYTGAERLG